MKLSFLLLVLFWGYFAHCQNATGLYLGTWFNDATKVRQNYEVALSEYRSKISGYSYSSFVLNDHFYYSIHRVKALKQNGKLIIEEGVMLANNFPQPPNKGVRRTSVIPLNNSEDSIVNLEGTWSTNRTKQFYSITGSLNLKKDPDSSHSALIAHLKELKLIDNRSDVADVKTKPVTQKTKSISKIKEPPVAVSPPASSSLPFTPRKNKIIQEIAILNDSIQLSIYDNGVIDGDIVSVYLNGAPVLSNITLAERAAKKTIAIPLSNTDYELKLVAENLGSIPPNTGLLLIQDGDSQHTIYFSADLQTNVSIILRKK